MIENYLQDTIQVSHYTWHDPVGHILPIPV